jgi:hypothetical protein
LKDLRIGAWSQIEPGAFKCIVVNGGGRGLIRISGVAIEDGDFTYAVFSGERLANVASR